MPRFFVDHDFVAGLAMSLPAPVARHVQVLRLQPGAAITLFNGRDGAEWQASVLRMGKSEVEVRLDAAAPVVDRELPWHVTLAIGAPANDRMDALVEKAGELGAASIQPLICERSVLRLTGDRAEAKRRHWQSVAVAASEQCGRVRVATLAAMRPLSAWRETAGKDSAAAGEPLRIVLSFDASAMALAEVIGGIEATASPRLVVLSGPEGGLAPAEEEAAVAGGFVRTSLGLRVLRADTAPLAVLAWLGLQPASVPVSVSVPVLKR